MYIHLATVFRLLIVCLFSLLLVGANVTSVAAQASSLDETCSGATAGYASWLDKLQSLYGTVSLRIDDNGRQESANATFAIMNPGNRERLEYFVQAHGGRDQYLVLFVKDNFYARLENYRPGWEVGARGENYTVQDLEGAFFQADTFLQSAFKELRLLELSTCLGGATVAGQETIHYRLDIPPMLASMLMRHLGGGTPDDVQFGEIGFDFWLDKVNGYLTMIEGRIEASGRNDQERLEFQVALELISVDKIQLKVPEYIRILAMQQGLIEPSFTHEFVNLDE